MEPRRQSPGSYDRKMRPGGAKIRLNGGKMLRAVGMCRLAVIYIVPPKSSIAGVFLYFPVLVAIKATRRHFHSIELYFLHVISPWNFLCHQEPAIGRWLHDTFSLALAFWHPFVGKHYQINFAHLLTTSQIPASTGESSGLMAFRYHLPGYRS